MKHIFLVVSLISKVWLNMPDSLCPYLNVQQRQNMILQVWNHQSPRDTFPNQLEGTAYLDTIIESEQRLIVQYAPVLRADMRLQGDTIVLTHEICAPKCGSFTRYYDPDWKLLKVEFSPFEALKEEEMIDF